MVRSWGHRCFHWGAVVAVVAACAPDVVPPDWLQTPQIVQTTADPSVFSATLSAAITSSGNLTSCGFSLTATGGSRIEFACDLSGDSFQRTVPDLSPDTEYSYSAYVSNGSYRIYSREQTFRTGRCPEMTPISLEAGPFSIVASCHFSGGTLPESAGFSITEEGRENWRDEACFDGTSDLSCLFEGLVPETAYRIRPWFCVGERRLDQAPVPVRTEAEPDDRIASTAVKADVFSADFSATLSRTEGLTACGFGWAKDGGTFTERTVLPEGNTFSLKVEDLSSDTEYSYYAWAEAYGRRFTTCPLPFYTKKRPIEEVVILSLEILPVSGGADLTATLSAADGVTECGFGISANGRDFVEYGAVLEGTVFRAAVRNLAPGSQYTCYGYYFYETQMVQTPYQTFTTL